MKNWTLTRIRCEREAYVPPFPLAELIERRVKLLAFLRSRMGGGL